MFILLKQTHKSHKCLVDYKAAGILYHYKININTKTWTKIVKRNTKVIKNKAPLTSVSHQHVFYTQTTFYNSNI